MSTLSADNPPATEDVCAEISLGGKKDVDKAANAAKKAFETWRLLMKKNKGKWNLLRFLKINLQSIILNSVNKADVVVIEKLRFAAVV